MKRRGHHNGTLTLRGHKWLAQWMVGGKRFSQSTGETDREKAEQWLKDKLADITNADKVKTNSKGLDKKAEAVRVLANALAGIEKERESLVDTMPGLKVDDAWAAYVKTPKRKMVTPQTLSVIEYRWNRLAEWLKTEHPEISELRRVTKRIARDFAAGIRDELCPSTYNLIIATYQQIWSRLAEEIRADCNPWKSDNITRLDTPSTERRNISDDELQTIFEAARREIPPLEGLFTIMLYTGARLGDAATLEWRSIDLARGFIDIMPIKTKRFKTRVRIPILPPLRRMLEAYPTTARTGYVLPDIAPLYIVNHRTLSKKVSAFFRKCGLETSKRTNVGKRKHSVVTAHSFRHTFISKAANAGIPFAIVQGIVGHSTAKQCAHYFHENDDATLRAFRAFPTAAVPAIGQGETIDAEAVVVEDSADRLAALDAALAAIKANGDKAEIAKALERVRALAD